jgi:histidinol-phosphatase (PHP family)
MDLIGDFHVHTKWCGHARGEMREYAARAAALGLPAIGFAAHFPVPVPNETKVCLEPHEVELYVAEARRLRDAFAGHVEVVMGFEVDYLPEHEEMIRKECLERWAPDFAMGSIHIIDDWPFDHPAYRDRYAEWRISDLYRTYYARLAAAARSGMFDVIGHVDLVKKFGYRPEEDVTDAFEELLDIIAACGVLMEANTAGFDKPVGEMYPSADILKAARARNIPITMGSDSHAPEEVGRHFARAVSLLAEAGYETLARPDRDSAREGTRTG